MAMRFARPAARRLLPAIAWAAAAGLSAEEATRAPKKEFSHYKLTEERNIFAPRSPASPSASPSASVPSAARPTRLTGIVYDRRRGGLRGLLEAPGQSEPAFVGPGEATPLGPVVRVTFDHLIVQSNGKEIAIPVGDPLAGSRNGNGDDADPAAGSARTGEGAAEGAPKAGESSFSPLDAFRETFEHMKAKARKNMDKGAANSDHTGKGTAAPGPDEGERPASNRRRSRFQRRRSDGAAPESKDAKPEQERTDKEKTP